MLIQSQQSGKTQKKTADAKKVAIMIQKYLGESPNMLYEIITRNLGKNEISWDDLLKCLQDQFNLSYTVLKRQSKKVSISEAKWNNSCEFNKIIQYFKTKQTNYIHSILKPNLAINVSQHSSQCDILAILLEKQLVFYLMQQNKIICSFQFKYRRVKQKLIKKDEQKQLKRQQIMRQNQNLDKISLNKRRMSFIEINKSLSKGSNLKKKDQLIQRTQSANRKVRSRVRLNSNSSSQISSIIKRSTTDIRVTDWRKPSANKKQNLVKLRTNTTKKVFQYFENATLQNSIEIAKKFQESRENFQKYLVLDKRIVQKQIKATIEDMKVQKQNINYNYQLQKMKNTSKSLEKYRKLNSQNFQQRQKSVAEQSQSLKSNSLSRNYKRNHQHHQAQPSVNKMFFKNDHQKSDHASINEENHSQSSILGCEQKMQQYKMLENCRIEIVSFCFYENLLLISFYNREVRLYRVKKNLQRLKEELIFQKQNQNIVTFVQIYRSIFTMSYNIFLCSTKSNGTPIIKIYEISNWQFLNLKGQINQQKSKTHKSQKSKDASYQQLNLKQIYSCKLSFDPIYENLIPLGIGAYNQKGWFSLIETNSLNLNENKKCEMKLFQKLYTNINTGSLISFSACKAHANFINIYFVCKNGFIYLVDKISSEIKLLKKISQYKIVDIALIKASNQILSISQKGELMIINSQNLDIMYYLQTYVSVDDQSKLLHLSENKFLFYGNRIIKIIDIQENQQKLLEYQKPLKIYRNRIKIKQQQILLSKQAGDIQSKKNTLSNNRFELDDQSTKILGFSLAKNNKTNGKSNEFVFKSKLNKRKIMNFFSTNNSQTPHYILVLQNGQILIYDYKAEYFGSYLKNRSSEIRQCCMNKKMYYLGILYQNNSIQVVNIYNQLLIFKIPRQKNVEFVQNKRLNNKQKDKLFQQQKQILFFSFINYLEQMSLKEGDDKGQNQFLFIVDKNLQLIIFNSKGITTRLIDVNSQSIASAFPYSRNNKVSQCLFLDKVGDLLMGTQKGQIIILQKNTFLQLSLTKISYFPIIKIQPFSKFSGFTNSKQRFKYFLVLTENNQIFLFNKQNKIVVKVYSPLRQIQMGKIIVKQRDPLKINSSLKPQFNFKQNKISLQNAKKQKSYKLTQQNLNINQNKNKGVRQKASSIHYFSKIIALSENFVVYEWQQVYQIVRICKDKDQINQTKSKQNQFAFSITKSLLSYVSKKSSESCKNSESYEVKEYKRVGYLIQKITSIKDYFLGQMSFTSDKSEKNKNEKTIFESERFLFLQVWNSQPNDSEVINGSPTKDENRPAKIDKRELKQTSQKSMFPERITKPKENKTTQNQCKLYCFADCNKFTIVIEPQQQFHYQKNTINSQAAALLSKGKSQKYQNQQENSVKDDILISENSFVEQSKLSFSFQNRSKRQALAHHAINSIKKAKSVIRIYDLEGFNNKAYDFSNKQEKPKLILEQEL